MKDDLNSAMNSEFNLVDSHKRADINKSNSLKAEKNELKPPETLTKKNIEVKERIKYYDHTATTNNALPGAINTIETEDLLYNREEINKFRRGQNSPIIYVVNDGKDSLFVRVSGIAGFEDFSDENEIFPGDTKEYYNVYELRLRSPTKGLPYRVSEYRILRSCCPL